MRMRDSERLVLLERGLRLLRRGHTAGETRLVASWLGRSPAELLQSFARLPAEPRASDVVGAELVGILLVEVPGRGR
jgi:hypothetical protein